MHVFARVAAVAVVAWATAASAESQIKPWKAAVTPKLALQDLEGGHADLGDLRGRVVIVNFWATWCVPCKAEIPGFIDLQKKYGARGLQIIGISVDDPARTAKKYADDMKMNYPVLLAEGTEEILKAYDPIPSIPVSVVIGRDGSICSKHVGIAPMDVFEKELASLF